MRTFIEWLYKRFPPKLTINKQDWTDLRQEVAQYNQAFQALQQLNERLVSIEAQVRRLNDQNGYVNTSKGSLKLER